ncbi:MAG: hypothetical protein NTY01_24370, partial [Verrucomicrobia bacterium]|nr:hypothetical protein [Verrucomicrobiota bacterium]
MTLSLAAIVRPEARMKCVGFIGVLACVLFCMAEEKKESALELAFKLRDTSFLRGTPTVERVPFQSALAKMDVPLAKLRSIDFKDDQKTVVLSFQNGDRLEGIIHLKTFGLKTAYGKLEVELPEIASIQVSGSPTGAGSVPTEGLVGHWPLDGNANDVSGHGHHGKVIGATPTQGVSGGAYRFDGNAGIDLGPLDFSSEQFTVSGWIRTNEPAQAECWRVWIDKLDESGGPFELGIGDGLSDATHAANGPKAEAWNSISDEAFYILKDDTKLNLRDGRWHMYSFTYQKGSQKLYIDSELFASGAFSGPLPTTRA